MDKTSVTRILDADRGQMNYLTLIEISRMLEKYPYFSLMHIYAAKNAKIIKKNNLSDFMSKATVYAPDRLKLRDIILKLDEEQFVLTVEENNKEVKSDVKDDKAAFISEQKQEVQDIISEIDSYTEPDLSDNPTKKELIERFLQIEHPKLNDIKEDKSEADINEIVKGSVKKEFKIVTETMAKIFLKQGNKDKAIEIYRQLILDNPDKSDIFAHRIREIEDNQ